MIEKNDEILKNIEYLLEKKYSQFFEDDTNFYTTKIKNLSLTITDFVANGSFEDLRNNTEILDYEDYAYFIRNTDLKEQNFNKYVSKNTYEFLKKSSLKGHEIIISNVGDVGSVFLCPILSKPMTLGNNLILLTNNNVEDNYYLYYLFKSNLGQYLLKGITGGSAQQKFNKTDLRRLEIPMLKETQLKEFNNYCSQIYKLYEQKQKAKKALFEIKNMLLQKYFG